VTKSATADPPAEAKAGGAWVKNTGGKVISLTNILAKKGIIVEVVGPLADAPSKADLGTTQFFIKARPAALGAIKIDSFSTGTDVYAILKGEGIKTGVEYKEFTGGWDENDPVIAGQDSVSIELGATAKKVWFRAAAETTVVGSTTDLDGTTKNLAPTPGGPTKEVKIPVSPKAPKLKIDYVKGQVSIPKNIQISEGSDDVWSTASTAKQIYTFGDTSDLKNFILDKNSEYSFRTAANLGKKAPSLVTVIEDGVISVSSSTADTLAARDFRLVDGKLYLRTGFPATEYRLTSAAATAKWKAGVPAVAKDGKITAVNIRIKGNAADLQFPGDPIVLEGTAPGVVYAGGVPVVVAGVTPIYIDADANGSISGTKGSALSNQSITLYVNGDKFVAITESAGLVVTSWFNYLPAGLTATARQVTDEDKPIASNQLTVDIAGTPTEKTLNNRPLIIHIPASALGIKTTPLNARGATISINDSDSTDD
jgi:hypothetical protein